MSASTGIGTSPGTSPNPAPGAAHRRRGPTGRLSAHYRYSRFVGVMKVVLPALAAVLLALVVAWPRLTQEDERFRVGFATLSPSDVDSLSMVNARFHGVDGQNRPFTVTADVATERDPAKGLVDLRSPKADFTTRSGEGVYMEATEGVFNHKTQTLELSGEVSLFHERGYEVHTAWARVDLAGNTAWGDRPVTGHGPQGTVKAEGFEIRGGGREVLFSGRSELRLMGPKPR